MTDTPAISPSDRTILRDLARQLAEIGALPEMASRRDLWKRHNSLQPCRPLILVFPEGSWRELMPPSSLACQGEKARQIESALRRPIYTHQHMDTDAVFEPAWTFNTIVRSTGWGLEPRWHWSEQATGARTFDPVLLGPADLKKIHAPRISIDHAATAEGLTLMRELLGDLIEVRHKGVPYASFHMMSLYTSLRGLTQAMEDMYDNPGLIQDAMTILEDGYCGLIRQQQDLNLLSLNNDDTYNSSGGNGYTDELPRRPHDPQRVRPCDMWAFAESQELALVSPEMHERFALQYERRLLAPFGLNGYGCCEDLTRKLDDVLRIPHIRRISISPFADVDACAAKLQGRAIFSWKPHPAHLAGEFDEALVRGYIRHTLAVCKAHHCHLEMILKDTHTCCDQPQRFTRWCQIAREEVEASA